MSSILKSVRQIALGLLIGLLVIGFAVWGVSDVFTQRAGSAVVRLGDAEIGTQVFQEQFRRRLDARNREAVNAGRRALTNEEAYAQGLHNQVLSDLVTQKILSVDADDLGIGVNRRDARAVASEFPAFQNLLTGEFDENMMDQALRNAGLTRAQFEDDIAARLRQDQTIPVILAGTEVPREYATQRYNFLTEQRSVDVLSFDVSAITLAEDPGDEVLRAYLDENGVRYTAPEYRRVTLLRLEPFDFTADQEVTEEQLRDAFDYGIEIGEIGAVETRNITQLIAGTEDVAKTVVERLEAGEGAEAIADDLGLEPLETYVDAKPADILDPNVSEAAFAADEGTVASVYGSLPRWYVYRVDGVVPATAPEFSAERPRLLREARLALAAEALDIAVTDAQNALDQNQSFEQAAEVAGVTLATYDYFDRQGRTEDGLKLDGLDRIPGIAQDDETLREIFTSDTGFEGDLIPTAQDGYVAIRVEDIKESRLQELNEIRERVLADWRTEKAETSLDELAVTLTQSLEDGDDPLELAESLDGVGYESATLVRTAENPVVSDALAGQVFAAMPGAVVRAQGRNRLSRQVARVNDIIPNSDRLSGQFADAFTSQAETAILADIQNAYRDAVIADYPVTEFPNAIRNALGLDQQDGS